MAARIQFESELESLNKDLILMGKLASEATEKSLEALMKNDTSEAEKLISEDRIIDDLEKTIETKCLSLILRQQPVARDLRTVTAAIKVITDMERIGDQASDIAELSLRFVNAPMISLAANLPEMVTKASEMVHLAVKSYVNKDLALASDVIKSDDIVDALFDKVKADLISLLSTTDGAEHVDEAIDLIMIAKYLERIGDHAVNIAEWTQFCSTGFYKNTKIL